MVRPGSCLLLIQGGHPPSIQFLAEGVLSLGPHAKVVSSDEEFSFRDGAMGVGWLGIGEIPDSQRWLE